MKLDKQYNPFTYEHDTVVVVSPFEIIGYTVFVVVVVSMLIWLGCQPG